MKTYKIYKGYKEIEIKNIKGIRTNEINSRDLEKICRYMNEIKREGIKPFEVTQEGNEYYLFDNEIRLLAAKKLGYDKVPCLIRDIKHEIILRKLNKIYEFDEKTERDINNKNILKFCRKNNYKLNNL